MTKKTLGPGDMVVARMDIPAVPGLWPGGSSCERFGTSYAAAMQAIIEDVGPAIVAHYSAEIERLEEAVKSDEGSISSWALPVAMFRSSPKETNLTTRLSQLRKNSDGRIKALSSRKPGL